MTYSADADTVAACGAILMLCPFTYHFASFALFSLFRFSTAWNAYGSGILNGTVQRKWTILFIVLLRSYSTPCTPRSCLYHLTYLNILFSIAIRLFSSPVASWLNSNNIDNNNITTMSMLSSLGKTLQEFTRVTWKCGLARSGGYQLVAQAANLTIESAGRLQ